MAVPDRNQILLRISDRFLALEKNIINSVKDKSNNLKILQSKINDPKNELNIHFQNID